MRIIVSILLILLAIVVIAKFFKLLLFLVFILIGFFIVAFVGIVILTSIIWLFTDDEWKEIFIDLTGLV